MNKRTNQTVTITDDQRSAAETQIIEQSKRIEFYITEYSIELLANKMRNGEFVIPQYQREFTWEPDRKSRFVESVIMGLPIPFLFFWEMTDGNLEIVDGSQRLRTIEEFVLGEFQLVELEAIPAISHFKFSDLPESRQRKIRNRSIRGIVLNEHADEQARFDMFERINTGSKIANTAEVRRGALSGQYMDLIIELAELPLFAKLAPMSEKHVKERVREELVNRFFAYSDGLNGYKDRPAQFLFDYAKKMNARFNENPGDIDIYRHRFVEMIEFVNAIFPNGFSKGKNSKATPRARFEAIAIGSFLALQAKPAITDVRHDVSGWLDNKEFMDITGSDGANVIARLVNRMNYVRDRLLEVRR